MAKSKQSDSTKAKAALSPTTALAQSQKLTILAQDPTVRVAGKPLTAKIALPAERIEPGPRGYRVSVVDYDTHGGVFYKPRNYEYHEHARQVIDPYEKVSSMRLLNDPAFHAQNVYAIVMSILARFETALGRRVNWGFDGHQLKVVPHAFCDANAFYSREHEALLFGYFPSQQGSGNVFACLSHDVVAHETTHALVDGLRRRYLDPSSPDQAAFHEGFADIVALLSVFSLPETVRQVLPGKKLNGRGRHVLTKAEVSPESFRESVLFGLAKQIGGELSGIRGRPLRRSAELAPSPKYLQELDYEEPHLRGEVFVAAIMNAFLEVWIRRLGAMDAAESGYFDRDRVAEEGSNAAEHLLEIIIRSLDYAPPVHLEFSDFVSAMLTADRELHADDTKYHFRDELRDSFLKYGIPPSSTTNPLEKGIWEPPAPNISDERVHLASLRHDPDEMFRFVWENREALRLHDQAYTRILSVRPCLRIGPAGFTVHETIAEFYQVLQLEARDLLALGIRTPDDMPPGFPIWLRGGGTLVFDERGQLKFSILNRVDHPKRQTDQLKYLWENGYMQQGRDRKSLDLAQLHRARTLGRVHFSPERW